MKKKIILSLVLLVAFAACKSSSTNPVEGQKLRLITSDPDTASLAFGTVEFTVTVLDATGYGVGGAYIDFYDPIEHRARREGPTPENGEWHVTDTVPLSLGGGNFEFAFVAEHDGASMSDSLRLWIHAIDVRAWVIDSMSVNSFSYGEIGVQWRRPAADTGTDTVVALSSNGFQVNAEVTPFPGNSMIVYTSGSQGPFSISVHNRFFASKAIVWDHASRQNFTIYESSGDTIDSYAYPGINFANGTTEPLYYTSLIDLMLATDSTNPASGVTIISPSNTLSGFSGGKLTYLSKPVLFIDSFNNGLDQFYYTQDLSHYVSDSSYVTSIPLPSPSSGYSTLFYFLTSDGHYGRAVVGPVYVNYENIRYVDIQISYQPASGEPYASRPHKHH